MAFCGLFLEVMPVSIPVLFVGLLTCMVVEKFHLSGYGATLPGNIRSHLLETAVKMEEEQGQSGKTRLIIQCLTGIWLVAALAFHLAAVGIIGLSVIIILTSMNGYIEEHQLGKAFEEALPFTALLVVFFSIVGVIHDQEIFRPIIEFVLSLQGHTQLAAYYIANGLLSAISDNVFVATVYISETKLHFIHLLGTFPDIGMSAQVLMDKLTDPHLARVDVVAGMPQATATKVLEAMHHFDKLAVAINTGTNIPSVATPNGQAAFLFS